MNLMASMTATTGCCGVPIGSSASQCLMLLDGRLGECQRFRVRGAVRATPTKDDFAGRSCASPIRRHLRRRVLPENVAADNAGSNGVTGLSRVLTA
jgi:hypothetical protein